MTDEKEPHLLLPILPGASPAQAGATGARGLQAASLAGPTELAGRIRWSGSDEAVPYAIVSVYTLAPAALVGRAQADAAGIYRIESAVHWAGGHDLFVVVLDATGQILQVTRNGPFWLTGPSTRLDLPVMVRRRPETPTSVERPARNRRTPPPSGGRPPIGGTRGPVSLERPAPAPATRRSA
jgi:hypothetical protein